MTDLTYTIIDGDFPAGVKNKTATLVTSENEALLVDAGFTRADGHRLAAAVLDSGRQLTAVVISHADPDFYFGAEVIADAFPGARFLATPEVAAAMAKKYEGKLKAWAALGANLPTRLIETEPLTGDLQYDTDPSTFELNGIAAARHEQPVAVVDLHAGRGAAALHEHRPLAGLEVALEDAAGHGPRSGEEVVPDRKSVV